VHESKYTVNDYKAAKMSIRLRSKYFPDEVEVTLLIVEKSILLTVLTWTVMP